MYYLVRVDFRSQDLDIESFDTHKKAYNVMNKEFYREVSHNIKVKGWDIKDNCANITYSDLNCMKWAIIGGNT